MKMLTKLKKAYKNNTLLATVLAVITVLVLFIPIAVVANKLSSSRQLTPAPAVETPKATDTSKAITPAPQEQTSTETNTPPPKPSGNSDYHITVTCKDIVIPYDTQYYDDPTLYVGETKVDRAGVNGVKKDCTHTYDGKDWGKYYGLTQKEVYTETYPKAAYVDRGTKPKPSSTPPTPTYTYQEALQIAQNQCSPIAQASGTGSSAYLVCLQTVLSNYGY